jgi:hypothetical protein
MLHEFPFAIKPASGPRFYWLRLKQYLKLLISTAIRGLKCRKHVLLYVKWNVTKSLQATVAFVEVLIESIVSKIYILV